MLTVMIHSELEGHHANLTTNKLFCTTSETKGEVLHVKIVWAHGCSLMTVPGRWFCCGNMLPFFLCRRFFCVSHCVFLRCLCSIWVAEWPPFAEIKCSCTFN